MSNQFSELKQDVRYNVSIIDDTLVITPNFDSIKSLPPHIAKKCMDILSEAKCDFDAFDDHYTEYCHGGDKSIRLGAIYNGIELSEDKDFFLDVETKNKTLVSFHVSTTPDPLYYYEDTINLDNQ